MNQPKNKEEKKHICCDGECNHDDCCGKIDNYINCPKNKPTQEPMEWESEFDRKFGVGENSIQFYSGLRGDNTYERNLYKGVKQFIQSQIKQAEERGREKLVTKINQLKKPILDKIDAEDNKYWKANRNNDIGYNQALKEILSIITNQ